MSKIDIQSEVLPQTWFFCLWNCYQDVRYCILQVRKNEKNLAYVVLDDVPVAWVYEQIQAYKYLGWCSWMVLEGEVSLHHGRRSLDLWLLQCRMVKKQTHSFIKIVLWIHMPFGLCVMRNSWLAHSSLTHILDENQVERVSSFGWGWFWSTSKV